MPNIRGPELLVLVLILVMLFGAKRLPDAARGIGRSLRIFKAETQGLVESEAVPADAPAQILTGPQAMAPPAQGTTPEQQPIAQPQPPSQA